MDLVFPELSDVLSAYSVKTIQKGNDGVSGTFLVTLKGRPGDDTPTRFMKILEPGAASMTRMERYHEVASALGEHESFSRVVAKGVGHKAGKNYPFIISEYVIGTPLADVKLESLSRLARLTILARLVHALAFANDKLGSFSHSNLHPHNIMVLPRASSVDIIETRGRVLQLLPVHIKIIDLDYARTPIYDAVTIRHEHGVPDKILSYCATHVGWSNTMHMIDVLSRLYSRRASHARRGNIDVLCLDVYTTLFMSWNGSYDDVYANQMRIDRHLSGEYLHSMDIGQSLVSNPLFDPLVVAGIPEDSQVHMAFQSVFVNNDEEVSDVKWLEPLVRHIGLYTPVMGIMFSRFTLQRDLYRLAMTTQQLSLEYLGTPVQIDRLAFSVRVPTIKGVFGTVGVPTEIKSTNGYIEIRQSGHSITMTVFPRNSVCFHIPSQVIQDSKREDMHNRPLLYMNEVRFDRSHGFTVRCTVISPLQTSPTEVDVGGDTSTGKSLMRFLPNMRTFISQLWQHGGIHEKGTIAFELSTFGTIPVRQEISITDYIVAMNYNPGAIADHQQLMLE